MIYSDALTTEPQIAGEEGEGGGGADCISGEGVQWLLHFVKRYRSCEKYFFS